MKKIVSWSLFIATIATIGLTVAPVYAERPRAVGKVIKDTEGIETLRRQNTQRAHAVFNDYLYKSQRLDKIDNDVQYLVNEASKLQGEELGNFVQSRIIPKNSELLRHASSITSSSSAIRELNEYFINYAKLRSRALNCLAEISRYKVPASYMRSFTGYVGWGCAVANFSEFYSDEHIPYSVRTKLAELRSVTDELYLARNKYLNRRAFIERNVEDVITEDER